MVVFGACVLDPPTSAFLQTLKKERLLAHWPLASSRAEDFGGLAKLRLAVDQADAASLPALENDFLRLFVGLPSPLAPPYESVYLGTDHLLCEQPMLAVRQSYRQHGFALANSVKLPDDHLGLQLCFVAHLMCAPEQDPAGSEPHPSEALSVFLSEHLSLWIQAFADRVAAHAQTAFYAATTQLTLQMIEELAQSGQPDRS